MTLPSEEEQARLPAAPPPEGEEALAVGLLRRRETKDMLRACNRLFLLSGNKYIHQGLHRRRTDQHKLQERHLQRIEVNWLEGGPVEAERLALVAHFVLLIVFCLNISSVPEKLPQRCFFQFFNHHRRKPFIVTFIVFTRF